MWLTCMVTLALSVGAPADGFRCGTRLIRPGDSVTRLEQLCGPPRLKVRTRVRADGRGDRRERSVVQWIYDRGRHRDMIVSVHGSRVITVELD